MLNPVSLARWTTGFAAAILVASGVHAASEIIEASRVPAAATAVLGALSGERLHLVSPRLSIALPDEPDLSALEPMLRRLLEAGAGPGFRSVLIEDGTVEIVRGNRSMTLQGVNLEFSHGSDDEVTARATFNVAGAPGALSLDARLPPANDAAATRPASVTLEGGGLGLRFSGDVRLGAGPRAAGRLKLEIAAGSPFAALLGGPLRATPFRGLSLAGDLTYGGGKAAIEDTTLRYGQSMAQGFLSIDLSGQQPNIDATLAFTRLELTDALVAADGATPAPSAWTTELAHLLEQAMHNLDADLRLSAEQIDAGTLELGRTALSVTLRQGRLLADAAESAVAGGMLNGQIELTLDAPGANGAPQTFHLQLRSEATTVEIDRLLAPFSDLAALRGVGSAQLHLKSSGGSPGELLENLAGGLALTIPDGGSLAMDLAGLATLARQGTLHGWPPSAGNRTEFDQLEANFTLRGGNAFCDRVRLETGSGTLIVDGSVNLAQQRLYMRIDVDELDTAASAATRADPSVLMLKGPWTQPSIHYEDLAPRQGAVTPDGTSGSFTPGNAPLPPSTGTAGAGGG
ncbi:MAG: AsmA family protein [Rhizobiales bacterium]|nr:AsmA family protein [Hyphomicrobiales bacterium]